jgi:hypothetical protein
MKTYDEIKDIMVNRLGLRDMAAYKAYNDEFHRPENPRVPTEEEIALLSPDEIDNGAFWRVAEELFQTDPVTNCSYGKPYDIDQANRYARSMYHIDGFIGLIEHSKLTWAPGGGYNLLEIGPGYGAFRDYINVNTNVSYFGADVYPKIKGVDRAQPNGLLSEETKARRYTVVVASNVFQHLSVRQRRAYYADIAQCLDAQGYFMVSMLYDTGVSAPWRDAQGRAWVRHYGQFTQIQEKSEIFADLESHFDVRSEKWTRTSPYGGWYVALCQKCSDPVDSTLIPQS